MFSFSVLAESKYSPISSFSYIADFSEGDNYEGDINDNGEPHGYGRYEWVTGQYYEGDWVKGNREGYGKSSEVINPTNKSFFYRNKNLEVSTINELGRLITFREKDFDCSGYGERFESITFAAAPYVGCVRDGKPHGWGVIETPKLRRRGAFDDGEWKGFSYVSLKPNPKAETGDARKRISYFPATKGIDFRFVTFGVEEMEIFLYEQEKLEPKRLLKQKKERQIAQTKRKKYQEIYRNCIISFSKDTDMLVESTKNAVEAKCSNIADDPSWFDELRYAD